MSDWIDRDPVRQFVSGHWTVSYQEHLDIFVLHDRTGIIPNHDELYEIIQEFCKTYDAFSESDIAKHNQSILGERQSMTPSIPVAAPPAPRYAKKPACGFIYLIRIGDSTKYKIGLSLNPSRRLSQLEKSSPYEMTLVHVVIVDDMVKAERSLHEKYKARRIRGEWFDLSKEEVAEFCSYKEGDL